MRFSFCIALLVVPGLAHAACPVADGDQGGADLALADGDCLLGSYSNIGAFSVPLGANVLVQDHTQVYATSITVDGVLYGSAGGPLGGDGASAGLDDATGGGGVGGGGPGDYGPCVHGGGGAGAGFGGSGGAGPTFNGLAFYSIGGGTYGSAGAPTGPGPAGSGGGGAGSGCDDPGASGGAGGASLHLEADTVAINGTILVDGQDGGNASDYSGGSGGGSGGGITVIGGSVTGTGLLSVEGGDGGNTVPGIGGIAGGGGGGGGGRIAVAGGGGTLAYSVSGGNGGASQEIVGLLEDGGFPGGAGSLYHEGGITLTAGGVCPGPVNIQVSGLTPSGAFRILGGLAAGSSTIPAGPCAGLPSGLGPSIKDIRTDTADAAGLSTMNPNLKAGPCGKWLQVVDETTCALSNPVVLP